MSDEPRSPDESGWVVEPSNALEIQVAVGAEAELTPALREALDKLVRALEHEQEVEVEVYATCTGKCQPGAFGVCNPQSKTCTPKVWFPCANKTICSVTEFGSIL